VGADLRPRRRDVHGEDRDLIDRFRAAAWFVWKLAVAVIVILLVLSLIGWLVDVVVDPAEQEISLGS
jgi:hypothetical protein